MLTVEIVSYKLLTGRAKLPRVQVHAPPHGHRLQPEGQKTDSPEDRLSLTQPASTCSAGLTAHTRPSVIPDDRQGRRSLIIIREALFPF